MTNARGQRPQVPEGLLLADGGEEPTDLRPLMFIPPVEVEVTLRPGHGEVGHVAVIMTADPRRAEGHDRELPLNVGVGRPERQELLDRRGTEPVLLEIRLDILRARHLVEVDELEVVGLDRALAREGEVLPVDVVVRPVVLAVGLHLLDGLGVVYGDDVVLAGLPAGDGGFIRACHLTAPLRVAYIVPTLCRPNAYHTV